MQKKSRSEANKRFWFRMLIYNGGFIILFVAMPLLVNESLRSFIILPIAFIVFYTSLKANQRLQKEIEERKLTEKALEHSGRLFRGIFNNASAGISLLSKEGYYRHANLTLCNMLGYTEEELRYKSYRDITFPEDIEASVSLWQKIWEGQCPSFSFEKRYICKNGNILWVEANLSSIRREDDKITDAIAVVIDITDRKRMEEELRHQATTDFLTGVDNRRSFMQKTQEEFSRAQRYKRELALLMIDLDKFKEVNDIYGHLVGDQVLRDVVKACKSALRETDILARIGGEEFAATLLESDLETARTVALRVQQKVKEVSVEYGGREIQITVSIGIGVRREEDTSLDDILKRADDALYRAKNTGRDKIVLENEL